MEYTVFFDVSQSGYRHWWFPACGLIFVVIGSILFRFRHQLGPRTPKVFPYFFLGFAIFWTIAAFAGTAGAYSTPGFPYAAPASLPEPIQAKLAMIKRGITRLQLLETWEENGGLTMNEFFLRGVMLDHRTVAVRIALRPAAMPEAIYADPDRRCRWLSKHKPFPNPKDVVMRVSQPFFGQIVID